MRRPIRNLSSNSKCPPRLFDLIIEKDERYLEVRYKDRTECIPWDDVVNQVDAATKSYQRAANE